MYLGNFLLNSTIDFKFTSRQFATGIPSTIASPVVSIFTTNSTVASTAGVTVTTNFASIVGLNHVRILATSTNGFTSGKDMMAVLTSGSIDGVSVIGEVVRDFSIENRIVSGITTTTGQAIADRNLARNIAGGSDTGRTVSSAMKRIRNRVEIAAGTMTVYDEDDTTPNWDAAVTTAAGNPVTEVDPS